jgi:PAS domain S-box-containing protein
VYDQISIPYVSFDASGHIERINVLAAKLLGVARDKMIGAPFALYVHGKDSHKFLQHLLSCRSHPQSVETELRLKAKDGSAIPARLSSTPGSFSFNETKFLYPTVIVDLRETAQP